MKVKVFDSHKIVGDMTKFEESIQTWLDNEGRDITVVSTTQSGDHARTVVTIFYK